MRTIQVRDDDCVIVISKDMKPNITIPCKKTNEEIPFHMKYCVGLAHLINNRADILDLAVMGQWNDLVDFYKLAKKGEQWE